MKKLTKPGDQLIFLINRLKKLSPTHKILTEMDITFSQIRLLLCVADAPGNSMKKIADSLEVAFPTVSETTFVLFKKGLIKYVRDPDDRRFKRIYLTDDGEKISRKFNQEREEYALKFLSGLLPDEQENFLAMLERTISYAESTNLIQ